MTYAKNSLFIFLIMHLTLFSMQSYATAPRITVVFIIDQFAYDYLYKLRPYLTGGIKFLLDKGINYENAHHPHAMPETAVGHAALNTGVTAKDHGIIADFWPDQSGIPREADDDNAENAKVFGPDNSLLDYGKSSKSLMADGISDQFHIQSQDHEPYKAFSISMKSRAAINAAGRLGKAIWFDKLHGMFTSSKAYFDQLPDWVSTFNTKKKIAKLTSFEWQLALPKKSKGYDFHAALDYSCSHFNKTRIGKPIQIIKNETDKEPYMPISLSPLGDRLTLQLAESCIQENLKGNSKMLLWVSLSCLDFVGHRYGPHSIEALDMIYHLDRELKKFMYFVQKKAGATHTLFALTSDHGVLPLQCVLLQEGLSTAKKLVPKELMAQMNEIVSKNYGIQDLVVNFQMPQFYFDRTKVKDVDTKTMNTIVNDLRTFLMNTPGIKNFWTAHELDTFPVDPLFHELELYFKTQRYPGRSGDIFVQAEPFTLITSYAEGTSHESPYNYDTHVPLILYQKGRLEHKKILQKVYTTQFANTLAQLFGIAKPSMSTAELLPGIFESQENINEPTKTTP